MKNLILLAALGLCLQASAQKTDRPLEKKIREAIAGYGGDIGVYVKNLHTGRIVAIHADTIFPTASIVKVPILTGIMHKIYSGQLRYDSSLVYKDSLLYEGSDILGSFKNEEKISLKKVIMLMLTTSDNTASLWLQSLAGGGQRINELMDSLGLRDTRVNSRTPGRETFRARYQWGQTTPAEMGRLFEMIYRGAVFSPFISERMLRNLGRNFWDVDEGISQIPPYIEVFSKNGCVNASRSEAMIVNAPRNPFVLCVFTKKNRDESWTHDNEAWAMARKLSALCWRHFSPKDRWQPAKP